jgi:hypothetical protein
LKLSSEGIISVIKNSFEKNAVKSQIKDLLTQKDNLTPERSLRHVKSRNQANQSAMSKQSTYSYSKEKLKHTLQPCIVVKQNESSCQLAHFVKVSMLQRDALFKLGYNPFTFDSLETKAQNLKNKLQFNEFELSDMNKLSIQLRNEYRKLRELLKVSGIKYKDEIINMTVDESGFVIVDNMQSQEDRRALKNMDTMEVKKKIVIDKTTQTDILKTLDEELQVKMISQVIESEGTEEEPSDKAQATFSVTINEDSQSSNEDDDDD